MSYTKRQFVEAGLEEIGMAEYVFDLGPEQLLSALRRLDSMMAEWNGKGIRLGYPIPATPESSDLDTNSGVPDSANEAIITNLAIRIAPSYGKTVSPMTVANAKSALNVLLARATFPPQRQLPYGMSAGAGHKSSTDDVFLPAPVDNLQVGPDAQFEFE